MHINPNPEPKLNGALLIRDMPNTVNAANSSSGAVISSAIESTEEVSAAQAEIDSIKSKISSVRSRVDSTRETQLKQAEPNNQKSHVMCAHRGPKQMDQKSLTIEASRNIEDAKKVMKEIKASDSLNVEEKIELVESLKGVFETLDAVFTLEQKLTGAETKKAQAEFTSHNNYLAKMTNNNRKAYGWIVNGKIQKSEVKVANSKIDQDFANSNASDVKGFMGSLDSMINSMEL